MLVNHYGFWSLNAACIAYLVGETGPVERFGFGYPFARVLQRRFARDSKRAMVEAVDGKKTRHI